ncbi:MAG: hypothetical protein ACLSGB_00910 [Dorea sp.]
MQITLTKEQVKENSGNFVIWELIIATAMQQKIPERKPKRYIEAVKLHLGEV